MSRAGDRFVETPENLEVISATRRSKMTTRLSSNPKRNPKRQRETVQARSAYAGPGEHRRNVQFWLRAQCVKHAVAELRSIDGFSVLVGWIVWVKWRKGNAEDYIGR